LIDRLDRETSASILYRYIRTRIRSFSAFGGILINSFTEPDDPTLRKMLLQSDKRRSAFARCESMLRHVIRQRVLLDSKNRENLKLAELQVGSKVLTRPVRDSLKLAAQLKSLASSPRRRYARDTKDPSENQFRGT